MRWTEILNALSKHLKKMKELAVQLPGRRTFQTEGRASVKGGKLEMCLVHVRTVRSGQGGEQRGTRSGRYQFLQDCCKDFCTEWGVGASQMAQR